MRKRWFVALAAALLCLGVSLSAAWLWQTLSDAKYEAGARLMRGDFSANRETAADELDNESGDDQRLAHEDQVLSPDVLSAAAALLQERGVPLSLASPFDPVADYLLEHTRVVHNEDVEPGEISIRCTAVDSEEALQMLKAVVDAYLASGVSVNGNDADLSPDGAEAELWTERDQLTEAIEHQKQVIDELTLRLQAAQIDIEQGDGEVPAPREVELERLRQAHREAATRLAEARRDIDNKLPVETVAARITDVPTRTRVLERLNLVKLRDERQRQEVLQQKWSAVYGRNHPRMVEIRERIEALESQLADFPLEQSSQGALHAGGAPAAIVLAAFESESTSFEASEEALAARLSDVQHRYQEQQALQLQLGEARQELSFLHAETDRVQKLIAVARREQTRRQASVITPPALDRQPMEPRSGLPMAASCVAGMALYLLLLWQIRSRWLKTDRQGFHQGVRAKSINRVRFRSQEEEQLLRLKLASARGQVAPDRASV